MDDSPVQRVERSRKRGRPLTSEEKWMVQRVFETVDQEKSEGAIVRLQDPSSLTSTYTGVARSMVATIATSVRQTGQVPVLTSPGTRQQPAAIPVCAEGRMREFVFEKPRQGTICHAGHVHALLKDECGLEVHERTVQRHLSRMGFCWLRTKNRPRSLRENAAVRQQRHDYLYAIRKNRHLPPDERSRVVYVDERFRHHHHGGQYAWFAEHDVVERLSGKGRRWCCMHAMQENALIEGAFRTCEAKQGRGDSHGQLDWAMVQQWFQEQLRLHLPPRSLIVLDRCAVQTVSRDASVPSQMKKVVLQKWLTDRGIPWEEPWLRARLMPEVDRYRDQKPMVEIFAEDKGHKVLFLPVHHPELHPIEFVWAAVKNSWGTVFSNSTSFKDPRHHLEASIKKDITPEYCTKVYEHVRTIEDEYWNTDLILDDAIEIEDDDCR